MRVRDIIWIYELNAKEAKHPPVIESSFNETHIIQQLRKLYAFTEKFYCVWHHSKIRKDFIDQALELQLEDDERLRSYTTALLKDGIVCSRGSGKGTTFYINPRFVANAKVNIRTSLNDRAV